MMKSQKSLECYSSYFSFSTGRKLLEDLAHQGLKIIVAWDQRSHPSSVRRKRIEVFGNGYLKGSKERDVVNPGLKIERHAQFNEEYFLNSPT